MDKINNDDELINQLSNTSFTKPIPMIYTLEKIQLKAKEFNWSKEQILLFLVILRTQSIDINDKYDIANIADLNRVRNELSLVMTQIRNILQLAIEKNEWLISTNDNIKLLNKIQSIQIAIKHYYSSTTVYDILTQNIKSLINNSDENDYKKALSIMTSMNEEERDLFEYEILHGTKKAQLLILWDAFELKQHFTETYLHKDFLFVSYSELQKYCPNISIIDIIFHDWSKYLLDLSIGYTWRWIHEKGRKESSLRMLNNWLSMLKEGINKGQFFTYFNETWNETVLLHYVSEDHHPQFFGITNDSNRKDMSDGGVDESIIDMCARELFNQINCEKDMNALKTFKYIQFNTKYLERYNYNDVKKVIEIILLVLKENIAESDYKDKKSYYRYYLKNIQKKN